MKDSRKTGESPWSLLEASSAHWRSPGKHHQWKGLNEQRAYCVCKRDVTSSNCSRAHAANRRAWRWSRERFEKYMFHREAETGIFINCQAQRDTFV